MLFNSSIFILFFVIVTSLYFILPYRYRGCMLLVASCIFYMFFKAIYILILLLTILVDYIAGISIAKAQTQKKKKVFLLLSIIVNVSVLAVFKYYNFLNSNISGLLSLFSIENPIPMLTILLPIGLSFHTFQAMSYTIEIYRGKQTVEKNLGTFALYVMYYPQLVAGPIERPQNVLHQFYEKHDFDYARTVSGLQLMLWGFFAKVVIADNLSVYVNNVYNHLPEQNAITCLVAMYFFAIQIYCDFYGYTCIARGASRIMGIELMKNFNVPYIATSIKEFWSRWHISLSTWFRDYLYIPLGGNRKGKYTTIRNLLLVFLISGLWHGANWTFLIWGLLHGIFISVETFWDSSEKKEKNRTAGFLKIGKRIFTFHLVAIAWIFFRMPSIGDALTVCKKIFTEIPESISAYKQGIPLFTGININNHHLFIATCLLTIAFFLIDIIKEKKIGAYHILDRHWVRYISYSFLLLSIFLYGYMENISFIYFQF